MGEKRRMRRGTPLSALKRARRSSTPLRSVRVPPGASGTVVGERPGTSVRVRIGVFAASPGVEVVFASAVPVTDDDGVPMLPVFDAMGYFAGSNAFSSFHFVTI